MKSQNIIMLQISLLGQETNKLISHELVGLGYMYKTANNVSNFSSLSFHFHGRPRSDREVTVLQPSSISVTQTLQISDLVRGIVRGNVCGVVRGF